jgi:hypothetical protein
MRQTLKHQGKGTGIDRDPGSTADTVGGAEEMNVAMIDQDTVGRMEEEMLSEEGDTEEDKRDTVTGT